MSIVWSHSSLEQFKNCPHQYNEMRRLKNFTADYGDAAEWGRVVHSSLEEYVRDGKPMPMNVKPFQKYGDAIKNLPGETFCEIKLAITRDYKPVAFFGPDVWGRGVLDVIKINGVEAKILDYKTGSSQYATNTQAERNAVMLFAAYPNIERVSTRWMYFKDGTVKAGEYDRADIPKIMEPTELVVSQIETAIEIDQWPKRTSGLCGYCDVVTCQFNTKAQRIERQKKFGKR